MKVLSSYAVRANEGEPPGKNGEYLDCATLDAQHKNLDVVIVDMFAPDPVALPLNHAVVELVGTSKKQSVAFLMPMTNQTKTPWVLPFQSGVLDGHVDGSAQLAFLFEQVPQDAKLNIAGQELPIQEDRRRRVETKSAWSLFAPLLAADGPTVCQTVVTLKAATGGYNVSGDVQRAGGKNLLFCPGARHTWLGTHTGVKGVFDYIESDPSDPLVFDVTAAGYRYAGGKGYVAFDEQNHIVHLTGATPPARDAAHQAPAPAAPRKIKGRLLTKDGSPIEGVGIVLAKSNGDHFEIQITRGLDVQLSATTSKDGRFEIPKVAPGIYALSATKKTQLGDAPVEFSLSGGSRRVLIDASAAAITDLGEMAGRLCGGPIDDCKSRP